MTFGSIQLNDAPLGRRRRRDLRRRGARAVRHHEHFRRLGAVGVDQAERRFVGRDLRLVRAGHRRDLRARAAVDRQRVEVPLARMLLGAGDVELLAVARQRRAGDLPLAGRQLLRLRRRVGRRRACRGASSRRAPRGTRRACCRAGTRRRTIRSRRPPRGSTRRRAACRRRGSCRCRGRAATYQRSLLSAERAPATASLPSSDTSGIDQRISRSAFLPGACDGGCVGPHDRRWSAAAAPRPAARSCRPPRRSCRS